MPDIVNFTLLDVRHFCCFAVFLSYGLRLIDACWKTGFLLPPKHRYRVFLSSVKGYRACQTMLSMYFLNVLLKCQIGVQDFSVLPPQSACWNSGCRCVGKGTPPTHGVPPRLCQRSDVHPGPPGGRLQDRTYIEASHR